MAPKHRNGSTDLAPTTPTTPSPFGGEGESLPGVGRAANPAEMAGILAGGEIVPRIISLDDVGSYVEGVIIGRGQVVPYTDAAGDDRPLTTWRFELAPGVKVDVLSAYELDKSLADLIGHKVAVVKGPTKKVGARQVNQYAISDKGKVGPGRRDAAPELASGDIDSAP